MGVHCNVSLDGFAETSHGKFRGDRASFAVTVATVEKLGRAGVLQGLLCTPNTLAFQVGNNTACGACSLDSGCGKGCPAAVVAAGGRIGDVDAEQCPVTTVMPAGGRRLLPLMPT